MEVSDCKYGMREGTRAALAGVLTAEGGWGLGVAIQQPKGTRQWNVYVPLHSAQQHVWLLTSGLPSQPLLICAGPGGPLAACKLSQEQQSTSCSSTQVKCKRNWQPLTALCCCSAAVQVPSIEGFMQQYHMQCPMAYTRLVQVGLPATIEHRKR